MTGRKPEGEKFPGAEKTYTFEGIMPDGKALQMGTSHLLGEGFARAQNMEFQDKDMQVKVPYLTSWGVTTRLIGTLIMVHGDQNGLVMPPHIAPLLLSIIPIFKGEAEKEILLRILLPLSNFLESNSIEYLIDDREEVTPGVKFFESEIKGIPFRIEIGMRDFDRGEFTLFERDINKKSFYPISLLSDFVKLNQFFIDLKINMHDRMLKKAEQFKEKNTFFGDKLSFFTDKLIEKNGFFISYWCGGEAEKFKEFQLSVRCVLENGIEDVACCLHENCIEHKMKVVVARSY